MVSILIKFINCLKKIKKGYLLDDRDNTFLKGYLGYEFNSYLGFPIGIIVILMLISVLLFIVNYRLVAIILTIIVVGLIIYFIPILFWLYRKLYNNALITFVRSHFTNYLNYNFLYTVNMTNNKENIFCFFDEYYFYIFSDFLVKKDKLITIDPKKLNEKPIIFTISDVTSFVVDNSLVFRVDDINDVLNKTVKTNNFAKIDLKSFKSLILGYEIGLALNKFIPYLNEYKKGEEND